MSQYTNERKTVNGSAPGADVNQVSVFLSGGFFALKRTPSVKLPTIVAPVRWRLNRSAKLNQPNSTWLVRT